VDEPPLSPSERLLATSGGGRLQLGSCCLLLPRQTARARKESTL
jgi:hypothetical protein